LAGGACGAGGAEVISRIGDTIFNKAKANGINPQELLELQKMREKDRQKWLNDNNEDLKELNSKIDKLEEQRNNIIKKIETENDPTEKAKLVAAADELKKEITDLRKEKTQKEKGIKEVIEALPKGNLTAEQFQAEGNKPLLGSFKN
jgi:seryl-tRNA synthetase